MEFLEVNLTKDSSLLLHAIHSPFYWRILMKTILHSGFKNTYKNPRSAVQEFHLWTDPLIGIFKIRAF
jgi:hypothetical protein